jgi:hypothetical protein
MRFRTALSLAAFFLLCFTVAVWSTPLNAEVSLKTNAAAETQTVSGKIASVGDAEFTLEVKQSQNPNMMKFLVDGNTKTNGKLVVGAQATVHYRSEDGRYIAINILVTPASGMQSH